LDEEQNDHSIQKWGLHYRIVIENDYDH